MNLRHAEMYRALWARVEQLLGDGAWHDYEQTIAELGKLIPPGVAIRASERDRRRLGPATRVQARDVQRQIESGRRTMLRVMFKSPRFETDRPGHPARRIPQRRIRLRDDVGRTWHGGCPNHLSGHEDALAVGPRGGRYWVCKHCGRTQRESQHARRESR